MLNIIENAYKEGLADEVELFDTVRVHIERLAKLVDFQALLFENV